MIQLITENLEKRFGRKTVFSGLSIKTDTTVLGIAGMNGSGKSTLLRCLAGLMKPTTGSVKWMMNNKELERAGLKNSLGYAAPYVQLYEELTVRENLDFIIKVRSLKDNVLKDVLQPLGADKLTELHYGDLSTGQQQRIKLAAAIIHDPEILMLDEPGSNLDEAGKDVVKDLVEKFSSRNRMVLIASNQKEELALCNEIIELSKS
ncbi:ABC transporter ATP-binding protein [Rhodohalobacter sp. 614A]|uniref:ABC transporter ATP-binding protein n=1 Tax=Rhodohalobacter sp. 614A TaxID=2908649 RepID=UPI001F1ABCD8|nr:ATP-binding cassette domain-containing protein [Rhodohalobacter sp. 614A]